MDDLSFRFKAYSEDDNIVVHVKIEGAEAIFRYTDSDAIAILASNMQYIINHAIDDYTLNKNFKQQIEDELEGWINNGDK